jgi:hypothetical protein
VCCAIRAAAHRKLMVNLVVALSTGAVDAGSLLQPTVAQAVTNSMPTPARAGTESSPTLPLDVTLSLWLDGTWLGAVPKWTTSIQSRD